MKITTIYIWKKIQWCILFIYYFKTKISNRIKIYYGGAITGDIGGPLVKLKRLKKLFPQSFFNFNVVYLLSNAKELVIAPSSFSWWAGKLNKSLDKYWISSSTVSEFGLPKSVDECAMAYIE